MEITVKKISDEEWGIYKDNKELEVEVSKEKAEGAADYYREYFKDNNEEEQEEQEKVEDSIFTPSNSLMPSKNLFGGFL